MLSLKQLLYRPVYGQDGVEIGKLRDMLLLKSDGKGVAVTDNGAYIADGILTGKGKISLVNAVKTENGAQLVDRPLYDLSGRYLGTIYDVIFGKTLKIGKITCDNGEEYGRGRICATGDIVIVKNPPQKEKRKQVISKQANSPATEPMRIQSVNIAKNATYPVRRRYGDFNFLLGKAVDKNITNFYGEVMIRAGDKVTHDVLRQAKISGKLIELCLHAK